MGSSSPARVVDSSIPQVADADVGLVLVDSSDHLLYANPEAVRVLNYRESQGEGTGVTLGKKLNSLLGKCKSAGRSRPSFEFDSGKRHYLCRVVTLDIGPGGEACPASAVLFERCSGLSLKVARAAAKFRLTVRERETVVILLEGLTNKEIAQRMGISHNTVRAFLRMVMLKMDVTTRAAIVGEVLKIEH